MDNLQLAVLFHETYERLAPSFGYETREDTKEFDKDSKNGKLMVADCGEILPIIAGNPSTHDTELPKPTCTLCHKSDGTHRLMCPLR